MQTVFKCGVQLTPSVKLTMNHMINAYRLTVMLFSQIHNSHMPNTLVVTLQSNCHSQAGDFLVDISSDNTDAPTITN